MSQSNNQTMKKVKKYNTFNELKNSKSNSSDARLALKKHSAFEKLIKEITPSPSRNSAQKTTKQ